MRRTARLAGTVMSLVLVAATGGPSAMGSPPSGSPAAPDDTASSAGAANHAWVEKSGRDRPPTYAQQQVYDQANDRVVVVLPGVDHERVDTWVRERGSWRQIETANAPSHRYDFALAYDGARDEVVLFGGEQCETCDAGFRDTWAFDGVDWTKRRTRLAPPAYGPNREMAYDPVRRQVVLYVGVHREYGTPTWTWDGRRWTEHDAAVGPSDGLYAFTVAWDPGRQAVVLHGGFAFVKASPVFSDVTWAWNGTTWSAVASGPEISFQGMATYGDTVVMFGGRRLGTDLGDTWILRDDRWELIELETHPSYQPSSELVPLGTRRVLLSQGTIEGTFDHWVLRHGGAPSAARAG